MADDRSPDMYRDCPWCAERILTKAIICRFCGRDIPSGEDASAPSSRTEAGGAAGPPDSPVGSSSIAANTANQHERRSGATGSNRLEGIKNWLAVFALGQIVVAISGFVALWTDVGELSTMSARGIVTSTDAISAVWVFDACVALMAAGSLLLLLLMFQRNQFAPRAARFILPASAVLSVISGLAVVHIRGLLSPEAAGESTLPQASDSVRGVAYAVIWFMYWRRSERVRNTYGSNGARWSTLPVDARRRTGRTGGLVVGVAAVVLALALLSGEERARTIRVAAATPPDSPDQEFDEQAVLAKNIREQGGNADSLYLAHGKTDSTWFQRLSAAAIVTDLADDERHEVAQLRALLLDRLDVQDCATFVQRGTGATMSVMTAAEKRRLVELAGIAVGRHISTRPAGRVERVDDGRIRSILEQYGSIEDRQKLAAFTNANATPTETCDAGKALYRMVLDLPSGTPESIDATYWLLDLVSGRQP